MTAAEAQPAGAAVASVRPGWVRRAVADTPGRLRTLSIALAAGLVLLGSLAAWTIAGRADATARVRDESGPLLIATQELSSSLAEADAAATSAFLSGEVTDRELQRAYDDTLARVAALLEASARNGGDDEVTHELIATVQERTIVYASTVERARVLRELGDANALATLQRAAAYRTERLVPGVESLAERARGRLDRDVDDAIGSGSLAPLAVAGMLAGPLAASLWMARRFRRVLNIPLALATLLVAVLGVWVVAAAGRQRADLDGARTVGLPAVVALADARESAYRLQTGLTRALLAGEPVSAELGSGRAALASRALTADDMAAARSGAAPGFDGALAALVDRPREPAGAALAAETLARWARYDAVLAAVGEQPDTAAATALMSGTGNTTFTGFNVTIDALLVDDRAAFVDDVSRGADRFDHLALAALLCSLVAAMASVAGFAQRSREYR